MTLKNSFLASLKENNKRRIWLWIVSLFSFCIIFPSIVAMIISQYRSNLDVYIEAYGELLGNQMVHNEVVKAVRSILCDRDSDIWLLVAIVAIVSGIQGFSYLYHKKKIDFYAAMPIKMKKRFLVIWLNGVLIYVLPYLIGLIANLLIVAGSGYMSMEIFIGAWRQFGMHLCFYLGVYHLVILAVMLTGNVIITYCAVGVLFLYESIIRLMVMGYMDLFFKFYSDRSFDGEPILSPFTMLLSYEVMGGSLWKSALGLIVFAGCSGTLAYICYLKRPAEAAGKAIAFSWPKSWLKILITVPAVLLVGLVVASMVNYNPLYGKNNFGVVFFAMAVATVFMCCLMQVIYEFDIKGILHKKFHVLISAAIVIVFFCIFRFDLFGFDTYIPSAEKVESVSVAAPIDDYTYYSNSYWNEDLKYMSRQDYVDEYMYLTDVGTINKLLKLSVETVNEYENLNQLYDDDARDWHTVELTFRMANKRDVCRSIYVDTNDEEMVALLDRMEASEEFISGAYMGASDILVNTLADETNKVTIIYGNGIYQTKMKREEAQELLKLYQEDILNSSFLKFRETVSVGSMVLSFERKHDNYTSYTETELRIYPFYEQCISYLKEKGYYMDGYLNPEDIERIQVTNYNYDLVEAAQEDQETVEGVELTVEARISAGAAMAVRETETTEEFTTRVMYDSEEDIQKLCEILYPRELLYRSWHTDKEADGDYMVIVYFKPDSDVGINNDGMAYYGFAMNEVPEFVAKDTAYVK